ncbi:MAG: hypothetical protein AAFQ88_09110 [Pseudomonadota bacterium]
MAASRLIAAVAALSLLGACATDQSGNIVNPISDIRNVTSDNQSELGSLSREYSETRLEGLAVGCGVGVGLGILAGVLIGGGEGAAVGTGIAALGCAAGYGAGAFVANQDADAQLTFEALDADIAEATERANHYQRAASTANRVVTENEVKIAQLNQQYRANTLTAEAYEAQIAPMAQDIEHLNELIEQTDQTIEGLESSSDAYVRSGINPAELERQQARLEQERLALRRERDRLEDALLGLPPGVDVPVA